VLDKSELKLLKKSYQGLPAYNMEVEKGLEVFPIKGSDTDILMIFDQRTKLRMRTECP
jgi:hypothetical protein